MSKGKGKKKDDYWESGAFEEDNALINHTQNNGSEPATAASGTPPPPPSDVASQANNGVEPAAAKGKQAKGKKKKDDYWDSDAAALDAAAVTPSGPAPSKPEKQQPAAEAQPIAAAAAAPAKAAAKSKLKAKGKKKDDEAQEEEPLVPSDATTATAPATATATAPASITPATVTTSESPTTPVAVAAASVEEKKDTVEEGDEKADSEAATTAAAAPGGGKKKKKAAAAEKPVKTADARRAAVAKMIRDQQELAKQQEEERKRLEEEMRRLAEEQRKKEEEDERLEAEERERKRLIKKKRDAEAKKKKDAEAEEERRKNNLARYGSATLPPAFAPKAQDAPEQPTGEAQPKQKRPIYDNRKIKPKANKALSTDSTSSSTSSLSSNVADPLQPVEPQQPSPPMALRTPAATTVVDPAQPAAVPAPSSVVAAAPSEDTDWETKDESELLKRAVKEEPAAAPTAVYTALNASAPATTNTSQSAALTTSAGTATAAMPTASAATAVAAADDKDKQQSAKKNISKTAARRQEREEQHNQPKESRSQEPELRSPICCVLGHVDTGKTKLLDKIRRTNYQEGEAGGITQQIGATYFPLEILRERTKLLNDKTPLDFKVPGLLVIDTPGHASFNNLRTRGSSLCDIAILVVDMMHGLEPQTLESIGLLKKRKCPFVVALNKVDRLYGWKAHPNSPIQSTLKEQKQDVKAEFEQRVAETITAFAEQGLNAALHYKNSDVRKFVSMVPTSAITGEGIPDLLWLLVQLTQRMMRSQLTLSDRLSCTILEVKPTEGFGTTIDVVLSDGELREGDEIVVCGMNGPIHSTIRSLLTPQPLKELRIKGQYVHHKLLRAAQGIKIAAHELDGAIAGSQLLRINPGDNVQELKEQVMGDYKAVILKYIDKGGVGVYVQASSLGSLEALLDFLKTSQIPVSAINLGNVHKKDVMKAAVMLERAPEFAVILGFDIDVDPQAQALADHMGLRIFTAPIIYHLFDQFTAYMSGLRDQKKKDAAEAVFPCVLSILQVFNKRNPLIAGVKVVEGTLRIGTPLCIPTRDFASIGRIISMEFNKKSVEKAKKGDEVAVRIEGAETNVLFGRNFSETDLLYSQISHDSLAALREHYADELNKEDQELLTKLSGVFRSRLHIIPL